MNKIERVVFLDKNTPPHIFTLIIVSGLGALSMSIFLSSILEMSLYFDKSYALMQLSISLYLLSTAIFQIIAGPLSDKFGRRLITLSSVIMFILASLGCFFLPNLNFLFFLEFCKLLLLLDF